MCVCLFSVWNIWKEKEKNVVGSWCLFLSPFFDVFLVAVRPRKIISNDLSNTLLFSDPPSHLWGNAGYPSAAPLVFPSSDLPLKKLRFVFVNVSRLFPLRYYDFDTNGIRNKLNFTTEQVYRPFPPFSFSCVCFVFVPFLFRLMLLLRSKAPNIYTIN